MCTQRHCCCIELKSNWKAQKDYCLQCDVTLSGWYLSNVSEEYPAFILRAEWKRKVCVCDMGKAEPALEPWADQWEQLAYILQTFHWFVLSPRPRPAFHDHFFPVQPSTRRPEKLINFYQSTRRHILKAVVTLIIKAVKTLNITNFTKMNSAETVNDIN
jgi:hypothetical protein